MEQTNLTHDEKLKYVLSHLGEYRHKQTGMIWIAIENSNDPVTFRYGFTVSFSPNICGTEEMYHLLSKYMHEYDRILPDQESVDAQKLMAWCNE